MVSGVNATGTFELPPNRATTTTWTFKADESNQPTVEAGMSERIKEVGAGETHTYVGGVWDRYVVRSGGTLVIPGKYRQVPERVDMLAGGAIEFPSAGLSVTSDIDGRQVHTWET
jgi:hypothetical protein